MYMKILAMVFESNLQSVLKLGFTFWKAKQQCDSSQVWIFILFNIISLKTCMKKLGKKTGDYIHSSGVAYARVIKATLMGDQ